MCGCYGGSPRPSVSANICQRCALLDQRVWTSRRAAATALLDACPGHRGWPPPHRIPRSHRRRGRLCCPAPRRPSQPAAVLRNSTSLRRLCSVCADERKRPPCWRRKDMWWEPAAFSLRDALGFASDIGLVRRVPYPFQLCEAHPISFPACALFFFLPTPFDLHLCARLSPLSLDIFFSLLSCLRFAGAGWAQLAWPSIFQASAGTPS